MESGIIRAADVKPGMRFELDEGRGEFSAFDVSWVFKVKKRFLFWHYTRIRIKFANGVIVKDYAPDEIIGDLIS